MPIIESLKDFEIIDRFNNKWICSIYKNVSYQEAPSFMRLRCSAYNYNRIMETNNDAYTLLRLLRYITIYLDELQYVSHDTKSLADVSPLPKN